MKVLSIFLTKNQLLCSYPILQRRMRHLLSPSLAQLDWTHRMLYLSTPFAFCTTVTVSLTCLSPSPRPSFLAFPSVTPIPHYTKPIPTPFQPKPTTH